MINILYSESKTSDMVADHLMMKSKQTQDVKSGV